MSTPYAARRTVTAVFCDVVGSTSLGARLDPETLHGVMTPYYDLMRSVLERHGGRVEKFIGDAVVGVFGSVRITEDDALRAVRAADEMRAGLVELNSASRAEYAVELRARIGVSTGEVVVHGDDTVVLGDVGNTAARLQQAAGAGEVLAAEATYRLVRDAAPAQRLELTLKGTAEPTVAYRILRVHPAAAGLARRLDAPVVGRHRERTILAEAFKNVCDTPASHLITVTGEAGIGKTRLVTQHLVDVRGHATVATGRCLSYGEGITLRPMVEILRGLVGPDLDHGLRDLLGTTRDGTRATEAILAATGLAATESTGLETWWAFRSVFSEAARETPIVVVVEDAHWAEPALLDLIEYLADGLTHAPLLFICLARPELQERRPGWGAGLSRTVMHLSALSMDEASELVDQLETDDLDDDARRRIVAAARGNPLFLEQMVALLGDPDVPEDAVPPFLGALLAARLDRLGPRERQVLGGAAIEGEIFHRSSVAVLTELHDPRALDALLDRLVRLELVDPATSEFAGETAFRFRHSLIREAAYTAVSKRLRSSLHQRHAEWLADTAADRAREFDEILGYHHERAFRLLEELGPISADHARIAESGATRLAAAGERAFARGDMNAAANLLSRATRLLDADDPRRLQWICDLEYAAFYTEEDWAATESRLGDVIDRAGRLGLDTIRWRATVQRGRARLFVDPDTDTDALLHEADEATGGLAEIGDELGLARAWGLITHVRLIRREVALAAAASENAAAHAVAGSSLQEELTEYAEHAWVVASSPYSVHTDLERCARLVASSSDPVRAEEMMLLARAYLEALLGHAHGARGCLERFRSATLRLGWKYHTFNLTAFRGHIERLAGRDADAEQAFLDAAGMVGEYGNRLTASIMTAEAARSAYDAAEPARARRLLSDARETSGWLGVGLHGLLLAMDGEWAAADAAAREAVRRSEEGDSLELRGQALLDRSHVFAMRGDRGESVDLARRARQFFDMRQSPVLVRRAADLMGG